MSASVAQVAYNYTHDARKLDTSSEMPPCWVVHEFVFSFEATGAVVSISMSTGGSSEDVCVSWAKT